MNILWLSHLVPYPPKGGVMQRSYNLLVEASKTNNIYLLALNQESILPTEKEIDEARDALLRFCRDVHILPFECGTGKLGKLWLLFSNFFSFLPYDVNWTASNEMRERLEEVITIRSIDLIHFDTLGLAQYRGNHPGKIPAVLNHHNIESHMMSRRASREKNLAKKIYFAVEARKLERYEKKECHRFATNITVSGLDGRRLKRISPSVAVETVANGVDIESFRPGQGPEEKEQNLLFVGGLGWYPNRDAMDFFFDDIWADLLRQSPDLKIYIVGRSSSEDAGRLSKGNPNVIVTGFVDDVREYFERATVFICPMRTGGGTRLKILDAMACGKAIVATSMACEGIDVTDGKNVLIADTPSEFLQAIDSLLADPERRASMGKGARQLAEKKYSWNIIGEKLRSAYEAALPPGNEE